MFLSIVMVIRVLNLYFPQQLMHIIKIQHLRDGIFSILTEVFLLQLSSTYGLSHEGSLTITYQINVNTLW